MNSRWLCGLAAFVMSCAGVCTGLATERHVPGEYGTIQAAIDACVAGDVVIVADGTYAGAGNKDLDFGGRAITVRSASDDPNTCIIDCEGSGRGFYFHTNETAAAVVQGLTIRHGNVTSSSPGGYYGGGVYCNGSNPTLTNCTITGNRANPGGGVSLVNASPSIMNNTIAGNSAEYGGGLSVESSSSPTITHNTITGNSASSLGGGLNLAFSSPTVANNTIAGNTAHTAGGLYLLYSSPMIVNNTISSNNASVAGGGLSLSSSSPTIVNNMVTGNRASGFGAGLYLKDSSPTIANNTIAGNRVLTYGGGLYLSASAPTIANNTITGNNAYYAGGLYLSSSSPTIANTIVAFNSSGIYGSGGSPTLWYNCVYGNATYNYSGIPDPTGTSGNISADPLFRNPNGPDNDPNTLTDNDYRLAAGSPCIDAGSNGAVPADTPDLDGDGNLTEPLPFDLAGLPRFVDDSVTPDCPWAPGTCGTAPIVDLGAYELQGTTHLAGDLNCDGLVSYADIGPFVLALGCQGAYESQYPDCRFLDADINADGVVSFADINPFVALLGAQ